jgi:hypothetical protein
MSSESDISSVDLDFLTKNPTIITDLLQGDHLLYDKYLKGISLDKVQLALNMILKDPNLSEGRKSSLLTESWRINYKTKPPTPEEFLTRKYLGDMADSIYPRIRTCFLDFFDDTKPYRNAVLYPHIAWGKSTLTVLINLYITVHVALMRDAKKQFGLAPSSVLNFVLCSYNLTKAQEILLEPFINILERSEFFIKVRTKEDMIKREMEYKTMSDIKELYWTTASRNGASALQFSNNLHYKLASSPSAILGLTIVCGSLTELAFFRESGKSDEYIMRFFNDMKNRVESRMKGNFWGRTILDSSPNDLESPVDKYAMFDAQRDAKNYVVKGSRWKWLPEDFRDLDDTFPVFTGGSGKPPRILESSEGFNADEIIFVPRHTLEETDGMYQIFHDDLRKALKDIAGIPQGAMDKLFYDYDKIENCFVPALKNIYFAIKADAKQSPYRLVWDQVKDDLFVKTANGYRFYYKPSIPRVFHIDQSVASDLTAIAFVHVEKKQLPPDAKIDLTRDLIYVVDFVVPISPLGGRINLDSIKEFISDVYSQGGVPIVKGSFDTYQSEASLQYLQRLGIEMEHVSVDETLDPYMFMAQLIEQGNLKIGRNIFFKNNLKSLRITQRKQSQTLKIDHTMGDIVDPNGADYNWDTSLLGINGKDVSDAIAGALYLAKLHLANDGRSLTQIFREDEVVLNPFQIKNKTYELMAQMGLGISK